MVGPVDDPSWDDWAESEGGPFSETDGIPATRVAIPVLHLDGFDGPMDLLLDLAERQRIDFGRMSVLALAEQFVAALEQLEGRVAIERRADWLVMATRLVLLRSRLLFPENPAAAEAAERDAAAELWRIAELARMRAAAAWLATTPMLGQDVFARGRPELVGVYLEAEPELDVIAFLWASMALFDDEADDVDTTSRYRPHWIALHAVPEARDRILRRLAERPEWQSFEQLLPESDGGGAESQKMLRRRSGWTSTFVASLELARQGDVLLRQHDGFAPIQMRPALDGSAE